MGEQRRREEDEQEEEGEEDVGEITSGQAQGSMYILLESCSKKKKILWIQKPAAVLTSTRTTSPPLLHTESPGQP